jgi:hypothetical protein
VTGCLVLVLFCGENESCMSMGDVAPAQCLRLQNHLPPPAACCCCCWPNCNMHHKCHPWYDPSALPPSTEPAYPSVTASCPPADVLSPKRATAHAPAAWLAALCECTPLRLPGGLDTVPDWRVTVRPPLHLVNDLPVAAHYQLWEGGNSGGPGGLQLRQQGRLEGGEGINVYSVDMRRQVRRASRGPCSCHSRRIWQC